MKIVVVLLTHIDNLPPARTLLLTLLQLGYKVSLITMYSDALPEEIKKDENFIIYDLQSKVEHSKIKCLINRFKRRIKLRGLLNNIVKNEDIVWTVTDYDAMECGKILSKFNHVMQLMELIEDIPYFDEFPLMKANLSNIGSRAKVVVVPEYNRACIQQAYWNLKDIPIVLPNKPITMFNEKFAQLNDKYAMDVIEKIKGKKIVLYQGVFGYERVLDQFIEAVELLGDEYCVLLMGRNDDEAKKLLNKYPNTYFIPFLKAPEHLKVTSYAHIGILSYVNTNNIRHYLPLNALYCAPNKIYEYANFGIPMIGNNIPGLNYPFEKYNIGKCAEKLTAEKIAEAIKCIEKNYNEMSKNCIKFFNSVDIKEIVEKVITIAKQS
ncbi:glycosyltransferase [Thomasclavelia sp.]